MNDTLYKPQNQGIQIQLRRYRDSLAISGGMVIIMSIWDIIKLFIVFFLGEDTIAKHIEIAMNQGGIIAIGTEFEKFVKIISWIVVLLILFLFCAVAFLYHLYIGLNAYRVGRQTAKKCNRLYLVFSFLSAIFTGMLIISNIFYFFNAADSSGNIDLAFFIMEVTALVNYILILYAAYKIRKFEKIEWESK